MDVSRVVLAALTAGILLAPPQCLAQSTHPEDLAQGKIIVAPRDSPDPYFANSVILLAHYDATGALGLMIHYRSNLPIKKALTGIPGAEKRDDPVFIGGPVELPVVMALVRSKSGPIGSKLVRGNLYLVTSKPVLTTVLSGDGPPSDLRVFIGYSGWGAGQLEREVQRSGWYIFDYDEGLVFDEHPETLWDRMIHKAETRFALFLPPGQR